LRVKVITDGEKDGRSGKIDHEPVWPGVTTTSVLEGELYPPGAPGLVLDTASGVLGVSVREVSVDATLVGGWADPMVYVITTGDVDGGISDADEVLGPPNRVVSVGVVWGVDITPGS
jgi:hypothetical protein